MIFLYASAAGESGTSVKNDFPSSQQRPIRGSRGNLPKKGTSMSDAIFSAPPVVGGKICDSFCVKKKINTSHQILANRQRLSILLKLTFTVLVEACVLNCYI